MTDFETLNLDFIEANYRIWKSGSQRLAPDWHAFFLGFEMGSRHSGFPETACDADSMSRQSHADNLIHRYRDIGHLLACMDPLASCPVEHPLLDPTVGRPENMDANQAVQAPESLGGGMQPVNRLIQRLKATYCRSIGVEYMHIQDPGERAWLQNRMEPIENRPEWGREQKQRILFRLTQSALFESFLNKTYVGVTRFSLEGGDVLIPVLDLLCDRAVDAGCREIILGMAHRGRLNVLAHILEKPITEILSEFENCYDPQALVGSGDVKYHNGFLSDIRRDNHSLRLLLVPNPSHLEAVNPVVEGLCRARQEQSRTNDADNPEAWNKVWPVLIHGDAAFAGQGIVAETLNMSQLPGYRTGGTIHIIINNQIGYTTLPEDARSSRYATDIAKMLMVPVFHVHGEDPEAAAWAITLAADYRRTFHKDVLLDLVCYRRYGHNEGDDPYFTQPRMVERIRQRPSPHELYRTRLVETGDIPRDLLPEMETGIQSRLESAYAELHGTVCPFPIPRFYEHGSGYSAGWPTETAETGVDLEQLRKLARILCMLPEGFSAHPKIPPMLKKRQEAVETGEGIDWANAESLAFASLLSEGTPVRLSGQDCRRGTFSQRHCVLTDTQDNSRYTPLHAVCQNPAVFSVVDSMLAEASILGFEYGYSLVRPESLVLWEAQFGDFVNNAQSVIDLFIASGEAKWQRQTGLTLLLPHGLEGLGPEHSSARPERFLQLCAGDNMAVCNPTTPAQYFHLLRRQVRQQTRKPLVVLTPKSLLRHPSAVSRLDDLANGGFQAVLADPEIRKGSRVLICSGKIYYDLVDRRSKSGRNDIVLIRIEQLHPFDRDTFRHIASEYSEAREWIWIQEEPENMGAARFIQPLIQEILERGVDLISRRPSPSPATGFPRLYAAQKEDILSRAMGISAVH
jgi:2-oxoglutarate dehydrogenase E1 component